MMGRKIRDGWKRWVREKVENDIRGKRQEGEEEVEKEWLWWCKTQVEKKVTQEEEK